ncbi:hypothetical protein EV363DRAFT_1349618 [Boletus edulis]|nr:hypothetical protein EV363DRAFT_1349618 [Boletus edulis]
MPSNTTATMLSNTTATMPSNATRSPATPSSSLSPASPVMTGTSSGPDIGAIVGGAVAGVGAVALVVASLLCYWRYKRRVAEDADMVAPFVSSRMTPYATPVGFLPSQLGKTTSNMTAQPLVPPSSTPSSNSVTNLIGEIGMLRSEVSRLRTHQNQEQNLAEVGSSAAPPDYFSS